MTGTKRTYHPAVPLPQVLQPGLTGQGREELIPADPLRSGW